MNILNDNEIMLQVKAGDLSKMSILFNRHYRSLFRFMFHMTYNKEVSEDMVQNVFYRLLKYRHSFTGEGAFTTWMYHVGRNVLKDFAAKQKKTGRHYPIELMPEKINDADPADKLLEKKHAKIQLSRAMEKLNKEERELLTLCKLQGLKYREIAEIIKINENAVKVRVHRAVNQLKLIYKEIGYYEM